MRQVQEKHQAKKKKLYYAFVDLEKEFDRVPREVVRWALRKQGMDEWHIRTVMALYTEDCTVVRTDAGLSKSFKVKVGLHQGSVLSPLSRVYNNLPTTASNHHFRLSCNNTLEGSYRI